MLSEYMSYHSLPYFFNMCFRKLTIKIFSEFDENIDDFCNYPDSNFKSHKKLGNCRKIDMGLKAEWSEVDSWSGKSLLFHFFVSTIVHLLFLNY